METSQTNSIFKLGLLLLLFLLLQATAIKAIEEDDESQFNYDPSSPKGPANWGNLKPEWAECKNGQMQSPIDLPDLTEEMIPQSGKLIVNYNPANAVARNRGHDIQLRWEGDAGSIQINGTVYALQQAHWHSPSEHTIDGTRYDLELHMVHVNEDPIMNNMIAVIGYLYKFGAPNSFLSEFLDDIDPIIEQEEEEVELGVIDPREVAFPSRSYYRYMGSLTTPACDEGVVWTVMEKIRTVSRRQVGLLRDAVHDGANGNARPIQPRNCRDIHLYNQTKFKTSSVKNVGGQENLHPSI